MQDKRISDVFDEVNDNQEDKPQLGGVKIRRIIGYWWLILLFLILGGMVGFYKYSLEATTTYTSLGVIELSGQEKKLVGVEAVIDRRGDLQKVYTTVSKLGGVTSLKRVASSQKVQSLQQVIPPPKSMKPRYMRTAEELECRPANTVSNAQLSSLIRSWTTLSQREGTAMIDVKVNHPNAETALVIGEQIMQNYIDSVSVKKVGSSEETFKLLKQESEEASLELEKLEKSLKIYESVLRLSKEVSEKRAEFAKLKARYKLKHPKMLQSIAVNDDLFTRFQSEIKYVANSMEEAEYWRSRMSEIQSLEARMALGGASVAKVKQEWVTLVQNALAARASLLRTRVKNQAALFSALTKRISEIDVTGSAVNDDVVIAELPVIIGSSSADPYKPVITYALLGFAVGLGIAFFLSLADYKIYDVVSAEEASGKSCLSAIPEEPRLNKKGAEWESVLIQNSDSPHAEAIRNLRASVLLLGKRATNKVLMLTSAAPSEGKTTVSGELAAALALNHENVILVDLDLRKPKVHKLFSSLKGKPGISELFSGQATLDEVIFESGVPQLSVISAGGKAPNPAELLSENEITRLINVLRNHYDRVIIDTPPILPVSDSRVIATYVDKVLLVIRAAHSPIGAVIRAKKLLDAATSNVAGIVVNAISPKKSCGSYKGYKGYGEFGGKGGYSYYSEEE